MSQRILIAAVTALLAWFATVAPAASQTACTFSSPDCLTRVDTVHQLGAGNFGSYPRIYLVSYGDASGNVTLNDGADGIFVQGTCPSGGADGGSVLADGSSHCFFRQNLNGDLRQWGLIRGSNYDVEYQLAQTTPSISDASGQINAAFAALQRTASITSAALGIRELHTRGITLKIGTTVQIPPGESLTCDSPPVKRAPNANYARLPGSLMLAHTDTGGHPVFIDANLYGASTSTNDASIHDCAAIVPEWYVIPSKTSSFGGISFTSPPAAYADLEAIRANMVIASDFAIATGLGAKIHDLTIVGFDTCINANPSEDFMGQNIWMDCSVGLYLSTSGGISNVKDLDNNPFLTKQPGFSNEEYWNITNITADSANGECQLTVQPTGASTSFPLSELHNSTTDDTLTPARRGDPYYYPAWVAGFGKGPLSCLSSGTGRFGNDAGWAIHMLSVGSTSATLDLSGSKYTDTSAHSITTSGDWYANTGVLRISASISNLAPGMTVTSTDPSWPSGTVTVVGIIPRCTGPDTNDGYNGCVLVSPFPTGNSAVPASLTFTSPNAFVASSQNCDGTGNGTCLYYNSQERYVAGNSPGGIDSARLPASRGGHLGAGFIYDNVAGVRGINTFSYGHYYHTAAIDAADCHILQAKGDENGELDTGSTMGLYVAGASRGCDFIGQGPGKPANDLIQDTYGISDSTTLPSITADVHLIGKYGVGAITTLTGTPASWPLQGELHICQHVTGGGACKVSTGNANEYAAYQRNPTTNVITVYVRGRFGTAPIDWSTIGTSVTVFQSPVNNGATNGSADQQTVTVFDDLANVTQVASGSKFEVHHGGATFTNLHVQQGGNGFVSSNATAVNIVTSGQPGVTVYYENPAARANTTVTPDSQFASYVPQGNLNLPLSYRQPYGTLQAITNSGGISSTYVGGINVQNTVDFPATGILSVDSELISYHVKDANTLVIEQRALCGTTAGSHAHAAIAIYVGVLYGCPDAGQGVPQFSLDGMGNVSFAQSALAHGQVYMNLNPTTGNIQLCPSGGRGLIINNVLRAIPNACAMIPKSQTSAINTSYFIYADFHPIAIYSITSTGTPLHVKMYVSDTADYYDGVPITCFGVTGQPGTNVVEDVNTHVGSDGGGVFIELNDVLVPSGVTASGTGACSYVGLVLDTPIHRTVNGVEVNTTNTYETLVGQAKTDGSGVLNDINTKRDVASWFNRRIKTCRQTWGTTASMTGTTLSELANGSTTLRCEFVEWGQSDLGWLIFGAANDNSAAGGGFGYLTANFFDSVTQPEAVQWAAEAGNTTIWVPLGFSGSVSFASDNFHVMAIWGKGPTSSSVITVNTGSGEEIRIPQ